MPRSPVSAATLADRFQVTLTKIDPNHPEYVVETVDHLLRFVQQPSVSDTPFMFADIRRLLVFRGVCDVPAAAICDQGR